MPPMLWAMTDRPGRTRKHALRIGTAGWNVPSQHADAFKAEGSHLERYASVLNCTEINTSFYRPHRRTTYERWSAAVPAGFRFAVKVPQSISHAPELRFDRADVDRFCEEISGLGQKLGVLLLQLPSSTIFARRGAGKLVIALQKGGQVPVVCEPRHASWFTRPADDWLAQRGVARVAADPPRAANGAAPGGWTGLAYFRLHGSPRVYYSSYDAAALAALKVRLAGCAAASVWCIFDNTASGAAMANARQLVEAR